MPEPAKKFYLTTPIYYVNARPHIGHAYTTIAADVIARRHRLLGEDTFFLTGTDEHGQKVQRSAQAAGIPPQQFADEVSASFRNLWKRMGITNDDFLRTTEPRHHRGVQHLWRQLEANGAIYLSSYTGQYCVSDEAFADVPVGAPCPICGRPTETITEENYFFRLSDYQLPLIDLIESGTLHIQPETARNEVLSFLYGNWIQVLAESAVSQNMMEELRRITGEEAVEKGLLKRSVKGNLYVPGALKDLSISRTTFDWGIPVPGNPKHVVYVWLDALANYITAIGYGSDDPAEQAKFARYWPADVHLVGKEITRFHCVYWPAILLAAGLPLPKSIVANGWLLFEESKMSKSRGNVVRTETILDAFGPLCPPTNDAVILSEARSAQSKDPDTSGPADTTRTISPTEDALAASGLSGGSRGLQPPESALKDAGAGAPSMTGSHPGMGGNVIPSPAESPSLTPPTKAQQDLFAADVLRYFLLREIPFGQDGSFSFDALITRYNADLANGYGNLVSRSFKMVSNYFNDEAPIVEPEVLEKVLTLVNLQATFALKEDFLAPLIRDFDELKLDRYLQGVGIFIKVTDETLSMLAPWKAKDTDEKTIENRQYALNYAWEMIRIITALLYPILPYATASVWRQLGLGDIEEAAHNGELKDLQWGGLKPGTKLGPLAPIFPRADKGLAQLMTDMENPSTPTTPEPATTPTPEKSVASVPSVLSSSPGETSTISIDDFAKVDLRVAQIVVAERIPKADKLLRLEVDLGPNFDPPRRQILAGIAEHYTPEALIGRKVVIVANLAPRKMRGLESQGMVVAASIGPAGAPVLAGFLEDVELGARLK
ncbi:MAG: methionine--tRNA ligase subunit beta [Acidobacteriaceae bacterium]